MLVSPTFCIVFIDFCWFCYKRYFLLDFNINLFTKSLASCSSISCYLLVFTTKTSYVQIFPYLNYRIIKIYKLIQIVIHRYIYELIQIVKIGLILLTPNILKMNWLFNKNKVKPSLFMNLASQ